MLPTSVLPVIGTTIIGYLAPGDTQMDAWTKRGYHIMQGKSTSYPLRANYLPVLGKAT